MQRPIEANKHLLFTFGLNDQSERELLGWLEQYFQDGYWLPYCWLLPFALNDVGAKPFPHALHGSLMVHERKWFKNEIRKIPPGQEHGGAIARRLSAVLAQGTPGKEIDSLADSAARNVHQNLLTWVESDAASLRQGDAVLAMEAHLRDCIRKSTDLQSMVGSWVFCSGKQGSFEDFAPATWHCLSHSEIDPGTPDGPGSKRDGQQKVISRSETGDFLERSAGSMPAQLGRWSPMDLLILKEIPEYFSYKVASCEINQTWGSRLASSRMKSRVLLDVHIELGAMDFVLVDGANLPASDLCRVLIIGLLEHASRCIRKGIWEMGLRMWCRTPLGYDCFFVEPGIMKSMANSSDGLRLCKSIRHRMPGLFEARPASKSPAKQVHPSDTDLLLSLEVKASELKVASLAQQNPGEQAVNSRAMRRMDVVLDRDRGVTWSLRTRGVVGQAGSRLGCLTPDRLADDFSLLAADFFGSQGAKTSTESIRPLSQPIEVQL